MHGINIGNYLAKGKYGKVYEATTPTKNTVACKIMNKAKLIKNEVDYMSEIEILKSVDSPYIIRFNDSFEYRGNIYIIMEYIPGGDLFTKIVSGPIDEIVTLKYIKQIATGISYLHENFIMHRDLKPENIMITLQDSIKIIDFGHSVRYEPGDIFNKIAGTLFYLPPEMAKRSGYDYRVDIWTIGVLYFEMVTGTPPFDGDTYNDIIREICKCQYKFTENISHKTRFNISLILVADPDYRAPLSTILQMT
jgi:serine/threonine protein kinase